MARTSLTQKAERVLHLLLATRFPGVAAALAPHGFSRAVIREGFRLLEALTGEGDDVTLAAPPAASTSTAAHLAELDAWENKWFVIADAALTRHFPKVREDVFRKLPRTEGQDLVLSVPVFVTRVAALAHGTAQEQAARALLVERGLTDAVLEEVRALRTQLETVAPARPPPPIDPAALAAAEKALWAYYLEWSAIARQVIRDRRVLIRAGLMRPRSGKAGNNAPRGDEDDEAADDEIESRGE